MGEMIAAILLFVTAVVGFVLSIRSFREKGFLLNNAYLYASKKEREKMDKSPYYRQTAVVFLGIGILFLLFGLAVLLKADRLIYIADAWIVILLLYAVCSTVSMEKRKKQVKH